MIKIDRE